MQEPAKRFIKKMTTIKLPSAHQIGDHVVAIFPPASLLNCKVEAIKFKHNGAVYYDLSVQMKRPEWNQPQYARLTDVHWSFVCKQGQENNPITFDLAQENEKCLPPSNHNYHLSAEEQKSIHNTGHNEMQERRPTLDELQAMLQKMDFYNCVSGFMAPVWGGVLTFFPDAPLFDFRPINRQEILRMIDESK